VKNPRPHALRGNGGLREITGFLENTPRKIKLQNNAQPPHKSVTGLCGGYGFGEKLMAHSYCMQIRGKGSLLLSYIYFEYPLYNNMNSYKNSACFLPQNHNMIVRLTTFGKKKIYKRNNQKVKS
jgi:hypothetical protein